MTQPDEAAEMRMEVNLLAYQLTESDDFVKQIADLFVPVILEHRKNAQARSRQQTLEAVRAELKRLKDTDPIQIQFENRNVSFGYDALDAVLRKLSKETTE